MAGKDIPLGSPSTLTVKPMRTAGGFRAYDVQYEGEPVTTITIHPTMDTATFAFEGSFWQVTKNNVERGQTVTFMEGDDTKNSLVFSVSKQKENPNLFVEVTTSTLRLRTVYSNSNISAYSMSFAPENDKQDKGKYVISRHYTAPMPVAETIGWEYDNTITFKEVEGKANIPYIIAFAIYLVLVDATASASCNTTN